MIKPIPFCSSWASWTNHGHKQRGRGKTFMNLLFLTRGMPPPFLGGSGLYYYNIFKRFPSGEVTIFTELSRAGNKAKALAGISFIRKGYIQPGIPGKARSALSRNIRGLSSLKDALMMTCWCSGLAAFCLKTKPDVILIGQLYPVGMLGLFALRAFGIPYIVFVHGEELATKRHKGGYRWRLCSYVLQKANTIIANSTFTGQLVMDTGIAAEKIKIIHPMVDTDRYHSYHDTSDLKKTLGIGMGKVLLSVGRLIPRKGHAKVISMLNRLKSEFGKVTYIVVGENCGEEANLRKLAAQRGVLDSVIFAGRVPAEDLPRYYCCCDIMVLPNFECANKDTEGFGMVFLEANACGKPVVGGATGGTRDAVVNGQTGYLVDANDNSALYETVANLLANETEAKRLGNNGRNRVLNSFQWINATDAVRQVALQASNATAARCSQVPALPK
jgi:phosphatidylinositol alpha-1,6-mannosyltransferase